MAKKKPSQTYIPGTEPEHHADIDAAAELYVECRNKRMKMLEKEVEAHDDLLSLMREHDLEFYEFDGQIVRQSHLHKVKVKRKDAEEDGDDGL